ncbi:MAG: Phosphoribosylformylglycinamidine cyclo-ligase [candidate division WS2 bacterium]|uniref:Phosphoribosylformylglycinamidine cyclo-ligase n=1 Tax=Psychracetigena formicireducens TaxID=2986056 RepID=A0A9E2F144_PSYF1|nr:Phosphoribosylformylglycinamidine cyclo-ligase [Candidatus Psychracetigena formicireducens]
MDYKLSGVDIEAGNKAVEMMKKYVRSTYRSEVLGDVGGFGSLFKLDINKYSEPVLVSGTDGVGTKLKIAFMTDKHDTVGLDLVAMCVNDILTSGAEPLFFLDYIATAKLIPEKISSIVKGIAEGCKQAGCALIGGETAEMPGFYNQDEYDLAGFAVGVVNKNNIIDGRNIKEGDMLLGLGSSGLHSNGYSLVRKIFFDRHNFTVDKTISRLGKTLGEELLTPTKIYVKSILTLRDKLEIKGMAHITGGGLLENLPRCLPEGVGAKIDSQTWQPQEIFTLLQELGEVSREEMYRVFNMGIGFVVVVSPKDSEKAVEILHEIREKVFVLGRVISGKGVDIK